MMNDFIATFIVFFAVIDPIGTVPVFVSVTHRLSDHAKRVVAIKAAAISAGLLLFFVIAGEIILTAMDIPIEAFQVAGGIVLFLFALTMISGKSKSEDEVNLKYNLHEVAIYPLAIPSLASPGAMLASVLLTENHHFNVWQQVATTVSMLTVILIALVFMLGASRIHRLLGDSGVGIISRIMGMILASVAVKHVLEGIKLFFALHT